MTVESVSPDRTIPAPLPWQAAFPELQSYSGCAWYWGSVDLTMRSRLSPSFLAELLRQASAHAAFAYVVVDGGAEPPPDTFEGACWRGLVETADHVLLVTVLDTIGVARAAETLKGSPPQSHGSGWGLC